MGVTRILAKNIIDANYGSLPPGTVEATKRAILDALACALGGSSADGMKQLNELVEEWNGKQESTAVAFGSRLPSPSAALVNGSTGRALDFDDCYDVAPIHPGVPVVSAAFAIAEHKGPVGGKPFITAVALGIDLACRLSAATPVNLLEGYGWDYSSIYGYFSAAVTSAKILGLTEDKLLNAVGVAYYQSSGTSCWLARGDMTKAMGSGFAARGGVVSALMAERGLTAGDESLAGKWGIYNLFHRGDYIGEQLLGELGETFRVKEVSSKPYPCCRCIHPFIDCTLALVNEHDIRPEDVLKVLAYAGHGTYLICEPLELKQNPPTSVAAQFSIPWALANAIHYRKVEIKHFTDEALKSEDLHQLARKVLTQLDTCLSRKGIEPAVVEIEMKRGQTYSKCVEHALGSPGNPLSMADVAKKLRSCASYAVKPISKEKLDQVVQMVESLENVTDVGQIIRLLGES